MRPSLHVAARNGALTAAVIMACCAVWPQADAKAQTEKQAIGKSTAQSGGPDFDSATHRHRLITNFYQYRLAYPGNPFGYVPTNTVAFQEYALELLLELANKINRAFRIDLPSPITADNVTELIVLPRTNKFSASITILNRYRLSSASGKLVNYRDLDFWLNAYENKPELFRERASMPDRLSKAKALKMAREALHALGLTEEQLKISTPPQVEQWSHAFEAGKPPVPFPHYEVKWKRGYTGEPDWSAPVLMEVSGITGTVVAFENSSEHAPRPPLPTNYWQMLGMTSPTNSPPVPAHETQESP